MSGTAGHVGTHHGPYTWYGSAIGRIGAGHHGFGGAYGYAYTVWPCPSLHGRRRAAGSRGADGGGMSSGASNRGATAASKEPMADTSNAGTPYEAAGTDGSAADHAGGAPLHAGACDGGGTCAGGAPPHADICVGVSPHAG